MPVRANVSNITKSMARRTHLSALESTFSRAGGHTASRLTTPTEVMLLKTNGREPQTWSKNYIQPNLCSSLGVKAKRTSPAQLRLDPLFNDGWTESRRT